MDNQQPSITQFKMGWFCGIIDGEGCLGIWKRGGERLDFKPGFKLANTSRPIIDAFCSVLDRLECPYHVTHYPPRSKTTKEYWAVSIEGFKRLEKVLPVIKDLLVEKRAQAQLIYEWLESRKPKWHRAEYSERELEIVQLLKALNHRGLRE
jgi:hypothetical protein